MRIVSPRREKKSGATHDADSSRRSDCHVADQATLAARARSARPVREMTYVRAFTPASTVTMRWSWRKTSKS